LIWRVAPDVEEARAGAKLEVSIPETEIAEVNPVPVNPEVAMKRTSSSLPRSLREAL
jgi:hypothetical protein